MKLNLDCIHFNGDRPCKFHKLDGYICEGCNEYIAIGRKFLIVKLDAQGDVLRTTCILPALAKNLKKGDVIEWVTNPESMELLQNNPYVHKILNAQSLTDQRYMMSQRYDVVVNLDASIASSALATTIKADKIYGYFLNEKGKVLPSNRAAAEWQKMGAFDNLKKANQRTYQDWMLDIIEQSYADHEYVYRMTTSEKEWADTIITQMGIDCSGTVIGFNTGGGTKWHLKKWREEGFIALGKKVLEEIPGASIVLLGGVAETERNKRIHKAVNNPRLFYPGTGQSLRHFTALLSCMDVIVTGDTLAMHLALSVHTPVTVLFGPTSVNEIELYGKGEKIQANVPCKVCYLADCDLPVTCMDVITEADVFNSLKRVIAATISQKQNNNPLDQIGV